MMNGYNHKILKKPPKAMLNLLWRFLFLVNREVSILIWLVCSEPDLLDRLS